MKNNFNPNTKGRGSKPSNKKQIKPNYTLNIPMYEGGIAGSREYNVDDLIANLREIRFDLISIPVYASKKMLFGDKKGSIQVGYINKPIFGTFTSKDDGKEYDTVDFDVTIFSSYAENIKAIETPFMFPRLRVTTSGEIEIIMNFEIIPAEPEDWSSTDEH